MKAIQANYKGKGRLFDKLIRLWTRSHYSHTELIIDGVWYSSSYRDGGARAKRIINPNPNNWDFVEVEIDQAYAMHVFNKHKGQGYDRLGIFFSQITPLNIHSKNKVWCSELVAAMRGLPRPYTFNPKKIANHKTTKPAKAGFLMSKI